MDAATVAPIVISHEPAFGEEICASSHVPPLIASDTPSVALHVVEDFTILMKALEVTATRSDEVPKVNVVGVLAKTAAVGVNSEWTAAVD